MNEPAEPSPRTDPDPVTRYKAVIARFSETRERVRRWEHDRIAELETELVSADERLRAATARKERVRRSAGQWWQETEHALRGKRWLRTGELPGPDEARQSDAPRVHGNIQQAYLALLKATKSSPWPKPPTKT